MLTDPDLPIGPQGFSGIAGVSVRDDNGAPLGRFQHLLLEARSVVGRNGPLGTFYSEIDIIGSRDPFVPPKCDLNEDNRCDLVDLQLLMSVGDLVEGVNLLTEFDKKRDLNEDAIIDGADLDQWLADAARKNSVDRYFRGDANLNGRFDTSDLTQVFQVGQYEDGVPDNSSWTSGDWNGDRDFDSGDLVAAFMENGFERATVVRVPEPSSHLYQVLGALMLLASRRWTSSGNR